MPSTPSVHNHGGTGEQEARLWLPLHHFELAQDQPPDSTCVTTINSPYRTWHSSSSKQPQTVQLIEKMQILWCKLWMRIKMYINDKILSSTPGGEWILFLFLHRNTCLHDAISRTHTTPDSWTGFKTVTLTYTIHNGEIWNWCAVCFSVTFEFIQQGKQEMRLERWIIKIIIFHYWITAISWCICTSYT